MDQTTFQQAQQAYDAGDFRSAAKLFLSSADRGVTGNGAAYHMAGNALMRLRRFPDAATVYGHALRDDAYDKRGPLYVNLGTALCSMGEYANAASAFGKALEVEGYETPYKAWQGLAGAHMERGRIEEAAVAYRKAALDGGNPDPGKALVNLGLCLMGLGRPADAAEAYRAALGVDAYQGRGKALANLGMAYVSMGEYDQAVKAFEKSTQLHGHRLSETAVRAYETALEAIKPAAEKVEGWETGEVPRVEAPYAEGWATGELSALADETTTVAQPAAQPSDGAFALDADEAASELGFGDAAAVDTFFSMTEDEMRARDREERRARRAEELQSGGLARRVVMGVVAAVLVVGVLAGAFYLGFGWPMQATTVTGLIEAYKRGDDTARFWVAAPERDIVKEMAKVPPVREFEVGAVERGPWESSVIVTVTPETGAALVYRVTLAREGVGWKVTGIDNEWRSTDG